MIEHRSVSLWEREEKKKRIALAVVYERLGIHDQFSREAWQIDWLFNDGCVVVQETGAERCVRHMSLHKNNLNK